jgi:hypothetical protein
LIIYFRGTWWRFQNNLTELKSFATPPAACVNVAAAVMVLLANKTQKVPKDRSWKAAKGMMAKVNYTRQNSRGLSIASSHCFCFHVNFKFLRTANGNFSRNLQRKTQAVENPWFDRTGAI